MAMCAGQVLGLCAVARGVTKTWVWLLISSCIGIIQRVRMFATGSAVCYGASYSLGSASIGARVAGSAHGYMTWLSLVTSLLIVGWVHWMQQASRRSPIAAMDTKCGHGRRDYELRVIVDRHLGAYAGTRVRSSREPGWYSR
jgi:hypothetical protein